MEIAPVSGTAYVHASGGMTPLPGVPVRVVGYRDSSSLVTIDVVSGADGGYTVHGLLREYVKVSVGPQDAYLSPCSVRLWLRELEPLNIHVVARTELLANGIPPTLRSLPDLYPFADVAWGFVTERTSRGSQPIAGASVEHRYSDEAGDPTGATLTNADGFYEVCQYWDDYGQEVRARKAGYQTVVQTIGAEPRIDFELIRE